MRNKIEILEEISQLVLDLGPILKKDDEDGNYLHADVDVRADAETLEELVQDLRAYIAGKRP